MRQSWYFRLLGLLMLPLYGTGAWIAPALQVCPMHGSPAAAHASVGGSTGTPVAMSAADMASMPSHSVHGTPSTTGVAGSAVTSSDESTGHKHGCDCIGCCAGSNGPAVPVTQLALVAPASRTRQSIELKNAEVVVMHLEHVLPFATAPPAPLV